MMLSTERLTLRQMTVDDMAEFVRVHHRSEAHFAPWTPIPTADQTLEDRFRVELGYFSSP